MSLRAALVLFAVFAPATAGGQKPEVRRNVVAFEEAVDALVKSLRVSAPAGVRVELEEITPRELGWTRDGELAPARRVTLWVASGAHRTFGLLPPSDAWKPIEHQGARVLANRAELVVVAAPPHPVALTREAVDAARPLLERAFAPIQAWITANDAKK